ncbi:MAG: sulfotransferase domain-containing protein [Planctomycetaceae bacterium]|nr:sulfotransferase domain-containing protein [Planctomycetaceae bacterium]
MSDAFLKSGLRTLARASHRYLPNAASPSKPHKFPTTSSHVLIACFPKSGSTYLCKVLADLTGMQRTNFMQARTHGWYVEQDLYEPTLKALRRSPAIVHQHLKGTPPNLFLLAEYKVRPLILVRNIADTLLSLHDHLDREGPAVPTGYVPRHYFDLDFDSRLMSLIRMHLPWYFNFLAAWQDATSEIDQKWLSYEQLFADRVGTVRDVCEYFGIAATELEIQSSLDRLDADANATRKNIGKAGRGASLPQTHKQAIRELADCWHLTEKTSQLVGLNNQECELPEAL